LDLSKDPGVDLTSGIFDPNLESIVRAASCDRSDRLDAERILLLSDRVSDSTIIAWNRITGSSVAVHRVHAHRVRCGRHDADMIQRVMQVRDSIRFLKRLTSFVLSLERRFSRSFAPTDGGCSVDL
jgi:hypothetical protein